MRKTQVLEPTLTHAWHEATAKCCREKRGLVIDVGGNFGWYTLYSLALGCHVAVFEPVRHILPLEPRHVYTARTTTCDLGPRSSARCHVRCPPTAR